MHTILACFVTIICSSAIQAQPPRPMLVGIEYAYPGGAKTFSAMGVPLAKLYPDSISWGDMQRGPGQPIDFSKMDRFVAEYQAAGFTELILVLKSSSRWGSVNILFNPSPRLQFLGDYEAWVRAVVERYDFDGKDDMPGLKRPVRYFEIGSEFSTFEPEPPEDYVVMLQRAYRAAHLASNRVTVLHAAFLAPTVFRDHPKPAQYAAEFERVDKRIKIHGLDGMRKVLDQHKYFDMVNFHALTGPDEIEPTMNWLRYEMKQRKIDLPIAITDTTPNPLIAWGPATRMPPPEVSGFPARPNSVGIVVPPATEADRPALNEFFNRLMDGDRDAIAWTHAFVAADMVKKVIIAAEQGAALINTCFMEDLTLFKGRSMQAGAGISAWAGMADTDLNLLTQERTIKSLRPSYYAIQQLQRFIKGYDRIERVKNNNVDASIYKITKGEAVSWIAWHEPKRLYLPASKLPAVRYKFEFGANRLSVEKMIDRQGLTKPEATPVVVRDGFAELTLTPRPIFIRKSEQ